MQDADEAVKEAENIGEIVVLMYVYIHVMYMWSTMLFLCVSAF